MQSKQSKIDDLNFELAKSASKANQLQDLLSLAKKDLEEVKRTSDNKINDLSIAMLNNISKCNNLKNMFIGILWSFKYQFEVIQSDGATHRHKAFMCNCAKVNCDATIKSLEKESFIEEDLPF